MWFSVGRRIPPGRERGRVALLYLSINCMVWSGHHSCHNSINLLTPLSLDPFRTDGVVCPTGAVHAKYPMTELYKLRTLFCRCQIDFALIQWLGELINLRWQCCMWKLSLHNKHKPRHAQVSADFDFHMHPSSRPEIIQSNFHWQDRRICLFPLPLYNQARKAYL